LSIHRSRTPRRTLHALAAALLAAALPAPARAAEAADPADVGSISLPETRRDVVRMIDDGAAWSACARRLEADLAAATDRSAAPPCEALLASIRLNLADASTTGVAAPADIDALIANLSEARVNPGLLMAPLQTITFEPQLAWTVLAQRAIPGASASAYDLFRQGRRAIPALIAALDDQRATRTTVSDLRTGDEPLVFRVGDVSLALLQAITLCRFQHPLNGYNLRAADQPLFSQWAADRHAAQSAVVRDWWDATHGMSADDAVRWFLERPDTDRPQQLDTADALIALGQSGVVRPFLETRFQNGRLIDYSISQRLVRAGSRAPLDFVQEIIRNGEPTTEEMVRLIAEFGEIDDFKLLRDAVLDPARFSQPLNNRMVTNQMLSTDRPLAIPVLIAVIERREGPELPASALAASGAAIPSHLLRAGEWIQELSGKDFGFGEDRSPYFLARAFDDILLWWKREGQAAWDYDQNRPQATSGIR